LSNPSNLENHRGLTPLGTARLAGLLYLLVAVLAGFAQVSRLHAIVPGDAAATSANLLASLPTFRLSLAADLVAQVLHVFLILVLFGLLRVVDKGWAAAMAVLALVPVPIALVNLLNQYAAIALVDGGALGGFTPDQVHAQVLFYLGLQTHGVLIAQVFWGLWLFPFGALIFRSSFLPRARGASSNSYSRA